MHTKNILLLRTGIVLLLSMLSACACQYSGTPMDTTEKAINPACWVD